MVARERFTIAELVGRTGVPPATIHHYLRLGLLPSPYRSATNRFLYDERHALALRLVRLLRDRRRLPLATIRRVLPDLMAMEGEEAFRPEMWERVVDVRAGASSRRLPASRLLASALDAFSRRGYGDVNIDDICRAARIAKGSFYRHYRSKEDLFFGVVEAAGDEVVHAFDRSIPPEPPPRSRPPSNRGFRSSSTSWLARRSGAPGTPPPRAGCSARWPSASGSGSGPTTPGPPAGRSWSRRWRSVCGRRWGRIRSPPISAPPPPRRRPPRLTGPV